MDRKDIRVLQNNYQLELIEYKLLRERGSRNVWYIRTNNGDYCFKKYDLDLEDYQFTFALQEYLMEKRTPIPRLIPAVDQHLYALDPDGRVYVLFEWIKNEQPIDMTKLNHFKKGLSTLALFHKEAFGFAATTEMKVHHRHRLNVDKENKEIEKAASWSEHAIGVTRMKYHRELIEEAEHVKDNLSALVKSGALEEEAGKGYIAHNDFADINLLATSRKTYIIDLDDATYNFPTLDFEMLFIKTCLKSLIPPKMIPLWFQSYESIYRLTPTLKKYLIYHLQIPSVYRRKLNNRSVTDNQHDRYIALVQWEHEKNNMLQKLLK